jgi:hypothetical protein
VLGMTDPSGAAIGRLDTCAVGINVGRLQGAVNVAHAVRRVIPKRSYELLLAF